MSAAEAAEQLTIKEAAAPTRRLRTAALGLLALCILLAGILLVETVYRDRVVAGQRAQVLNEAGTLRAQLETVINGDVLLIRGVAALLSADPVISPERLNPVAREVLRDRPNIRNFAVSRGYRVHYVFPMTGNEAVLGLDYRTVPVQLPGIERAMEGGTIIVDGPIDLVQGGTAIIARAPIMEPRMLGDSEDRTFGVVSMPVDFESVLHQAGLLDQNSPLLIALRDRTLDGTVWAIPPGEVFFGDPELFDDEGLRLDVTLPGRTWQMAAAPRGGWGPPATDLWQLRLITAALLLVIGSGLLSIQRAWQARNQAEGALRHTEQRYRRLVDTLQEGIWQVDGNGRTLFANPRLATMLGLEGPAALLGRDLLEFVEPGPQADQLRALLHRRDGGANPQMTLDVALRRINGQPLYCQVAVAPMPDGGAGGPIGALLAVADLTARKASETELALAKSEAEAANRAKSDFLANMSHELRTPLNAIIGFSEVMRDQLLGPMANPVYVGYAKDIHGAGHHLLGIINDILDLSAVDAGRMELREDKVKLTDLLRTARRLVAGRAEKAGITLDMPTALDLTLRADPGRLTQILVNLMGNAVKFTPAGGAVSVRCGRTPDGALRIVVADTGIGMTPTELETARARFGQIDSSHQRSQEGTGLGLPITDALTELHGGRLELISEKGKGTTATVILPASRILTGDDETAHNHGPAPAD